MIEVLRLVDSHGTLCCIVILNLTMESQSRVCTEAAILRDTNFEQRNTCLSEVLAGAMQLDFD